MPSKKKKYNARFPPARIKKIMQSDEEVGKVAQVVPIIISKSLEIFVEQLLSASSEVTRGRNARTLTPTHIKNAILAKPEFSFLREVAQQIPDVSSAMEDGGDGEDSGSGGNGTTTGNNLAPVDFSMRGGGGGTSSSNSNNRIASTSTTAAATSLASTIHQPGVLNLSSSNSQVQYPQYPIQSPTVPQPPTPRPRGRPRKRPLPEQLELQQQSQQPPFVPLGGGGGLVQSPGPKKMANSRVSFSPVALIHGKMPPLGGNVGHHQHPLAVMSPSSSSSAASMLLGSGVPPPAHHNPTTKVPPSPSATSSSLEALTSVIASVSQPVLKHRPYLNTTTTTSTTPSSLISPSIPSATITRPSSIVQQHQQPKTIPIKSNTEHQPNSDYDSTDYDTNGHGEEEEDDEDEDEDDDDETEEDDEDDEAEMAVANLSTSNNNNPTMMTATQQRAQRTSVLVANPIVSSIKLSAPTGGDEDDDYDNI